MFQDANIILTSSVAEDHILLFWEKVDTEKFLLSLLEHLDSGTTGTVGSVK